jgi:hypothetical protein
MYFDKVVLYPQPDTCGDGHLGICRARGKAKPGSRQITVKGCDKPLLQMCVAQESAFPTRVFSLSGKTPHILCCVYEKESIGKEHFRKHSDLSRYLENVAFFFTVLCHAFIK